MLKKKPLLLLPPPPTLPSLLPTLLSSLPLLLSSSSPLPSSLSSSPLLVSLSMSPSSPLTPEYLIGHQIDLLCDTKSANVSSRKKKKKQTHSPFQQMDSKVKEQGLSQDEQDTPQCISHAGAVAIDDAGKELVCGNCKCCICPDKHQHSQNEKENEMNLVPLSTANLWACSTTLATTQTMIKRIQRCAYVPMRCIQVRTCVPMKHLQACARAPMTQVTTC